MDEKNCLDFVGRDILLRPLHVSTCEVRQTARHPLVLFFAALVVLILVIFDAGQLLPYMPWWQAMAVWAVAVAVQIGAYVTITLAWGRLQALGRAPVVVFPLIGITAYLLTYGITVSNVMLLTGRARSEVLVPMIAGTGYVFAAICEALYFVFVLPQLLHEVRARPEAPVAPPAPGRVIAIAGRQFPLEEILTLRGQEHFVRLTTRTGEVRLRARLSDLVLQTDEADGVLAHRSYWVARHAIRGLEQDGSCDRIVTVTGERLKVAQPRKAVVRDWMARHLPSAPDSDPFPARPKAELQSVQSAADGG